MSEQGELFKDAAARATDPATSHAAAAQANTARLEAVVVDALKKHGGLTTHEIAERTGFDLVSISPRMKPLVRKGLVKNSGLKRRGRSGRASIVWEKDSA